MRLKQFFLLTAAMLLTAANVWAAHSGTGLDIPISTFQNVVQTDIATLVFLGGSVGAVYSWHHDGFGRGLIGAAGAMGLGGYLGGLQSVAGLIGLTGALIH